MSKKFRRSLLSTFVMALVCVFTFTFVGCKDNSDPAPQPSAVVWTIEKAFAQAKSEGFTGTYEEFLQSLSSISDISLDDVGRLTFTLSNGTVIVAGTVTAGSPGRGIESVEVEPDRWGLVVKNIFTFSDGVEVETEYTTGAMYGREYDVESTTELEYLIDHDVKDIILTKNIGVSDVACSISGIDKDVNINLNGYTLNAESFSMSSANVVNISIKNGLVQTAEGVNISAPRGSVSFENVYAFDEIGDFNLNASSNSVHFDAQVAFCVGNYNDYISEMFGPVGTPEMASVTIPATSRLIVGKNAEVAVSKIVVTEVSGYALSVLNLSEHTTIDVEGSALVYGNVNAVAGSEESVRAATVAIGQTLYVNMNDAYTRLVNGDLVVVIGEGATWNIEGQEKLEIDEEFSVYYNSGITLGGNWADMVEPAVGYKFEEITQEVGDEEPTTQVIGFRFVECDHEGGFTEGYCEVCGAEEKNPNFAARVNGKGYVTFDKAYDAAIASGSSIVLEKTVDFGTAEVAKTISQAFTVVKNGWEINFVNVKYNYGCYLDESSSAYNFKVCSEHDFEAGYGYCVECGHKQEGVTFVAKIGDREYRSIADIFAQNHQWGDEEVVVTLLESTTWEIPNNFGMVNYPFTINKNGKTLTVTGADKLRFTNNYYYVDNDDVFKFARCAEHVYTKDVDGTEVYTGYCAECGAVDSQLNTKAQIAVDGVKYLSLENLIAQGELKSGMGTIILQQGVDFTTNKPETPIEVGFELYVDYHGKTVEGSLRDWFVPAEGYKIVEVTGVSFKIVADV